jgi:hypothetical protein
MTGRRGAIEVENSALENGIERLFVSGEASRMTMTEVVHGLFKPEEVVPVVRQLATFFRTLVRAFFF